MVNATVDNTPVTVMLTDDETYTPSTGSVQKVTVAVPRGEKLEITSDGSSGKVVDTTDQGDVPNVANVEMVITDSQTLNERPTVSGTGVYISGFEVN